MFFISTTSVKTIKWGIIGCGNVCEIKSGPAFSKCNNSMLYAVMRRDADKAADFALRHDVPHWYSNVEDIINNPEIDIVYIATPPSSHSEYTIMALNAGKAVYVEKPMAINYFECCNMLNASNQSKCKLWVAYYRRALSYFKKVKELIDNKSIGNIQTVSIRYFRPSAAYDLSTETQTWRTKKSIAGGGYFYDLAPHTIDILYFLLGKFVEVSGYHSNTANLYKVEDTVCAAFRFSSGIIGSGIWSYAGSNEYKEDTVKITGTKGYISFSTFLFTPIELKTDAGVETFSITPPQHIQQPLIQNIVDEMLGKGQCTSTGETAAHTSWVIDKIFGKI